MHCRSHTTIFIALVARTAKTIVAMSLSFVTTISPRYTLPTCDPKAKSADPEAASATCVTLRRPPPPFQTHAHITAYARVRLPPPVVFAFPINFITAINGKFSFGTRKLKHP